MRQIQRVGIAAVACLCGVLVAGAVYADNIYVSITGVKQGKFRGELIEKAFEDKIAGLSFHYAIVSPRDAATGMPTGKRMHKPIRLKKAWGTASTQLFQALAVNETLSSVVIDFVRPDRTGMMVLDHTIKLINASVASIEQQTEEGARGLTHVEIVDLVFQKIELTDHKSKSIAVDDWNAPLQMP